MPRDFAANKRGHKEGKSWPSNGAKCFHPSMSYIIHIIHDSGGTIEEIDRLNPGYHYGYRVVRAIRESDGMALYTFEPISSGGLVHKRGEMHYVRTRLANAEGVLVYHISEGILYTRGWYSEEYKA